MTKKMARKTVVSNIRISARQGAIIQAVYKKAESKGYDISKSEVIRKAIDDLATKWQLTDAEIEAELERSVKGGDVK